MATNRESRVPNPELAQPESRIDNRQSRIALPAHVASRRRDGRFEVLLHRSVAVISDSRVEIKSARSTVVLPLIGIGLAALAGSFMVSRGTGLPLWALVLLLLFCLAVVPLSFMSLISSIVGAEV